MGGRVLGGVLVTGQEVKGGEVRLPAGQELSWIRGVASLPEFWIAGLHRHFICVAVAQCKSATWGPFRL